MRDVMVELKALRLHGMAGAWSDLAGQGGDSGLENARWLLEHLLQAETVDRGMRSVKHQMHAAKFPVRRDLAGFDFDASPVDRKLVLKLAELDFTEQTQNVVLDLSRTETSDPIRGALARRGTCPREAWAPADPAGRRWDGPGRSRCRE